MRDSYNRRAFADDIKAGAKSFKDRIVALRDTIPGKEESEELIKTTFLKSKEEVYRAYEASKDALINTISGIKEETPKAFTFFKGVSMDFFASHEARRMGKGAAIGVGVGIGMSALSKLFTSPTKQGEEYHPENGDYREGGLNFGTSIPMGAVFGAGIGYATRNLDASMVKESLTKARTRANAFMAQTFATDATGATRQSWTASEAVTGAMAAAQSAVFKANEGVFGLAKDIEEVGGVVNNLKNSYVNKVMSRVMKMVK